MKPYLPVLLATLLLSGGVLAEDILETLSPSGNVDNDVPEPPPWVENASEVPPMPAVAALVEVPMVDLQRNLTLLIDPDQVNVGGGDAVTRLWIMIRSARGNMYATYEGYRCQSDEYRVYAHGSPRRGKVRYSRLPDWRPAEPAYRRELLKTVLCRQGIPRTPERVREAIRGIGDRTIDFILPN